jgi:hypothetical protein
MIPTERVYMQLVPKVSRAITEVHHTREWLKAQKGIRRYCQENPEVYQETLKLLSEAEAALSRALKVFMKGEPVVVR